MGVDNVVEFGHGQGHLFELFNRLHMAQAAATLSTAFHADRLEIINLKKTKKQVQNHSREEGDVFQLVHLQLVGPVGGDQLDIVEGELNAALVGEDGAAQLLARLNVLNMFSVQFHAETSSFSAFSPSPQLPVSSSPLSHGIIS
jgi:hypothetical protein